MGSKNLSYLTSCSLSLQSNKTKKTRKCEGPAQLPVKKSNKARTNSYLKCNKEKEIPLSHVWSCKETTKQGRARLWKGKKNSNASVVMQTECKRRDPFFSLIQRGCWRLGGVSRLLAERDFPFHLPFGVTFVFSYLFFFFYIFCNRCLELWLWNLFYGYEWLNF